MTEVVSHLLQSTLFAGAAWLLVLTLRRNRARTRYAIWLTASLKFLIPFALLISAGAHLRWRVSPAIPHRAKAFVRKEAESAVGSVLVPWLRITPAPPKKNIAPILLAFWFAGCAFILIRRLTEWRRVAVLVRAATPFPSRLRMSAVPILACSESLEPGVFGVFRPALLLPANIEDKLTPAQLDAVIAHELFHINRRDNLTAALHMLVEAVFWFHPLAWWIGARLVEERERACDEAVIESGSEQHAYAEGILNVCKLYVQSPSLCVSGVTGSNLRQRIERIMTSRAAQNLKPGKKLTLAMAALAAVVFPLFLGMLNARRVLAQTRTAPAAFEVVSVRPSLSSDDHMEIASTSRGTLTVRNVPLTWLIRFAWKDLSNQISGAPGWIGTARFDVMARAADSAAAQAQVRQMTRALLADRFNLKLHPEDREQQIYALVTARNGDNSPNLHKASACAPATNGPLDPSDPPPCGAFALAPGGQLMAVSVTMETFSTVLSDFTGRVVRDRTRLSGNFGFRLEWTPDQSTPGVAAAVDSDRSVVDSAGPSIFTALREQLGLKLESAKGPVPVLAIDHVERPTEN